MPDNIIFDNNAADVVSGQADALAQDQNFVQLLNEQSRQIRSLKQENDKLRHELITLRSALAHQSADANVATQVEHLFRRDVERQFEVENLKRKLRVLGGRENHCKTRHSHVSASLQLLDNANDSIPSTVPERILTSRTGVDFYSKPDVCTDTKKSLGKRSTDQKCDRTITTIGRTSLQEIDANQRNTAAKERSVKRPRLNTTITYPIAAFAEDGEDYANSSHKILRQKNDPNPHDNDSLTRLDVLLKTSHQNSPTIVKREGKMQQPCESVQIQQSSANVNIQTAAGSRKSNSLSKPNLANQQIAMLPVTTKVIEREHPRVLLPKPQVDHRAEDEEPFRSRPFSRLNLSHFKLNPKLNNGYDYAYNEVSRDPNARKCLPGCTQPCCRDKFRSIASSLGIDSRVSEDTTLMEFLGGGSEDKIRSLTSVARQNLLHEALTQKIANEYGKMHRSTHTRAQSPVDFWNADMPGTQEQTENQQQIGLREREEIQTRYREACKEDGKWMFADE